MSEIDPEVQRLMDFDCSVLHTEVGLCATEEEEQAKVDALLDERVNEEYEIAMSITRRLNRPTVAREHVEGAVGLGFIGSSPGDWLLVELNRVAEEFIANVWTLIAPKEDQDAE